MRSSSMVTWIMAMALAWTAVAEPADSVRVRAQRLFDAGRLDLAEAALERSAARGPDAATALLRGRLSLLANRADQAERWLRQVLARVPADTVATALLAESHYRRDRFDRAAALFQSIGRKAMADKLKSFRGQRPYRLIRGGDSTTIPLQTNRLPIVLARINDGPEVRLVIDTGAGELIIDPEFAERIGIPNFGNDSDAFDRGPKNPGGHGRADSITLGDFTIGPLPVRLLETAKYTMAAGGETIFGVIGTAFFEHFVVTLDYPNGSLALRRSGRTSSAWLEHTRKDPNTIAVPFWMSTNHSIVAHGTVNGFGPHLLRVDSGLAGGFTGPESIVSEARIRIFEHLAQPGNGGSGSNRLAPLEVNKLTLGLAVAENVNGVYGTFPPGLEYGHGFRIAGVISHDFLRLYALTLDFENMLLLLARP